MRSVHQLIVGASRHDAITSMALSLRDRLRDTYRSEVYSYHDPEKSVAGDVLPIRQMPWGSDEDALVYHSSFGVPQLTSLLQSRSEKLAMIYHNITPSRFYLRSNPEFAMALEWGRHELSLLRPLMQLTFADSRFNARDLAAYGYTGVIEIPAGVNAFRLKFAPMDVALQGELQRFSPEGFVLAVSQVIPHKRMEMAIEVIHLLRSVHRLDIGLVIAGPQRDRGYMRDLKTLQSRLPEAKVMFIDEASESQLATLYRTCSAYLGTSDHEGLAIPPLEAMAADAPVVIRGVGAVPETVGDAALVVPPDAGVCEIAEMMGAIFRDKQLRATMVARGRAHVRAFHAQDSSSVFLQEINRLMS